MSDQYGSFDTHIAILYDTLCHMASVIKCHIWHLIYELLLAAFDPFDNILGGGGWMRENQDKDHFSSIWI